jgi:hypothetical protein
MIRVPLSEFLEIYLGAVLVWTFAVWVFGNWRRRRRDIASRRVVIRCEICGSEFRDPSENPLTRCPACGRLNERTAYSSL